MTLMKQDQDFSPKFKDIPWNAEIGGMMDDKISKKIYPAELGEYTMFHLVGGTGTKKESIYAVRKGKTYVVEWTTKEKMLEKLEKLNYTLEWEENTEDGTKKVVLKHQKRGMIRSLLGID